MTPAQTTALVEVTQGDREAMVAYERLSPVPLAPKFADEILAGKHDAMARIQLIARHRLAALEEAARVADEKQWPPARGIPGQRRYKRASTLEWGETPFDTLDRGELLRLVQAYHVAASSARSLLRKLRIVSREDNPFWGHEGTGGRALAQLEYLVLRAGDGRGNSATERIYLSFFRFAYGLLFPGIADERDKWGIDDATGEMVASFKPGDTSPTRPHRPLRAIRWSDLLPIRATTIRKAKDLSHE